jgi:DNA repair exonuclease SbcCD ATPase subunit
MKVLNLEISNILSVKEANLSFKDNGLVLVDGWNYDDQRMNGAGKTSLFNALSFGLYDKIPRKISASEILKRGTKKGFVKVTVEVGKDVYQVVRERPKNVVFKKNDEVVNLSQVEFESVVKMNYNQFLVTMYMVQRTDAIYDRFINLNDTDKKDFLLQLMQLDEFAACKKENDKVLKLLLDKDNSFNTEIVKLQSQIELCGSFLLSNAERQDIQDKKAEVKSNLETLSFNLLSKQSVQKPELQKYETMEKKIRERLDELNRVTFLKQMKQQEHSNACKRSISTPVIPKSIDCPYCSNSLKISNASIVKADDVEALKQQHESYIAQVKQEVLNLENQIKELDDKLVVLPQLKEVQQKIQKEYSVLMNDYNVVQREIGDINHKIEVLKMTQKNFDARLTQHEQKLAVIEDLKSKISLIEKDKAKLSKEVELNQTLSALFAPTGAPAYILDSIVESFNEIVDDFIVAIWPNAHYQLQTFRENKDGEIKAKFSETLTINGQVCSIGSLSGGELRAFSLAVDFVMVEILNRKFGLKINPIIMDEPFDGLDSVGKEIVVELLEKLSENNQIWVVDHSTEAKAMFTDIVTVEKRDGTSCIKS